MNDPFMKEVLRLTASDGRAKPEPTTDHDWGPDYLTNTAAGRCRNCLILTSADGASGACHPKSAVPTVTMPRELADQCLKMATVIRDDTDYHYTERSIAFGVASELADILARK